MNVQIKELIFDSVDFYFDPDSACYIVQVTPEDLEELVKSVAEKCADICMEMSAKCAGLPGDGALAKDCADWIKKDFGVK